MRLRHSISYAADVSGYARSDLAVSFSGTATYHANSNDVANLTFAFQDAAFSGGSAAAVADATNANLVVDFIDPPVLDYSTTSFVEAVANNGTISTTVAATLTGDTLTGGARTLASPTDYAITSGAVPAGLTLRIASDGNTGLTISLDDSATAHASGDSVSTRPSPSTTRPSQRPMRTW